MKIKEEIKKTGDFWLPPYPGKVPGILSISNEKGIELEVARSFEDNVTTIANLLSSNPDRLNLILGYIQGYGFVILDGCQSKTDSINLSHGVMQTSRVILVNRVFTGFPQPQNDLPLFNTFKFSVEGIDEWVWIHGINRDYNYQERTTTISSKSPESIPFTLTNGMRLEITFDMGTTDSHSPWDIGVTQKAYFKLVSEDAQELKQFLSVAHKIIDLLCFTINETVSLDSMSATSERLCQDIGNGITQMAEINIYDPSVFYYSKDQPQIDRNRMLFRFSDIQDGAEEMINKWIESYEQYGHAFNLYFLAQLRPQPSLEARFLTLAQGLEAYHRKNCDDKYMEDDEFKEIVKPLIKQFPKSERNWFAAKLQYANELTLRSRIRGLVEPFEAFIVAESSRQLVDSIINTRNHLTHYDPDLELKAAKGEDLYILCLKLELLFELHFLELMGFSQEEIESIADNCPKLQWKRSLSLSSE